MSIEQSFRHRLFRLFPVFRRNRHRHRRRLKSRNCCSNLFHRNRRHRRRRPDRGNRQFRLNREQEYIQIH